MILFYVKQFAVLAIILRLAAQTTAALPSFEAAEIHPSKPGNSPSGSILPGGQIHFQAYSLQQLITFAWGLEPDMVTGPAWINSNHFDVVAKTPQPVPIQTVRLMLKALLLDRFRLTAHLEDKQASVYALVMGKRDSKLKPGDPSSSPECKFQMIEGFRTYVCKNMTMQGLAERLRDVAPAYLDRPVVDLTNLKGAYDFSLSWVGRAQATPSFQPGDANANSPEGPTIFQAVTQQLGLELAPRKQPQPFLVIDHADQLSPSH